MEQEVLIHSKLTGKVVDVAIRDFSKVTANQLAEVITKEFVKTHDADPYTWGHDIVLHFEQDPTVSFYAMLEASTNSYIRLGYHAVY